MSDKKNDKIRWLHLSDFHVGKDDYTQRKMFEYIIQEIETKKDKDFLPDFVFIIRNTDLSKLQPELQKYTKMLADMARAEDI